MKSYLYCLDPPSILQHLASKTVVAAGESVEFRCAGIGHPTPYFIWKQNGTPLDLIIEQLLRQNELDKYYHSKVGSTFVLEVKRVTLEEENDYYTCKGENDYESVESKKAYLSIASECTSVCMVIL